MYYTFRSKNTYQILDTDVPTTGGGSREITQRWYECRYNMITLKLILD